MNSKKYSLNKYDAIKGLQMFVITAVVMSLGSVIMQPDFDVFTADWVVVLKNAVNVAFVSTFSYIIKNFLSK